MIKRIEEGKINITITDSKELSIDDSTQEKIKDYWNSFIQKNSNYFDGDIFLVSSFNESNGIWDIKVCRSKYSRFVYAKNIGGITGYTLHTSIIFKTKDNYYVFVKDNHDRIKNVGGFASEEDFDGNVFIPSRCVSRELEEELGIDINDKNKIIDYKMSYLSLPNKEDNVYPTGIFYIGYLNYTSDELSDYLKKQSFDGEIKEFVYLRPNDYEKMVPIQNKEPYILDLLKALND